MDHAKEGTFPFTGTETQNTELGVVVVKEAGRFCVIMERRS